MPLRLVSVAVAVPALDLLTYGVPDGMVVPPLGARVVVPLGSRTLTGIALGAADEVAEPTFELRSLIEVLDVEPFLPPDVIELAQWVSDYYMAGPGAAFAVAMPPHAMTRRATAFKTVRVASLTASGLALAHALAASPRCTSDADRGLPTLGTRQKEALALLAASPEGLKSSELADRGLSSAVLVRLRQMGWATFRDARIERDPFEPRRGAAMRTLAEPADRVLTSEQDEAVRALGALAASGTFKVALLHGVTGSGKTEVYLTLADKVRQSGRGVLMLVPEIALTPAVAALFRARFGERVAIQHSGLSDGERHDQWHRIRRGDVDVVVGTRSAVFAPLQTPGLIVVDEEHDTSYKQEETPRYHGRDVAVMRGKFAGALVVLGSATPSMESFSNAAAGRYALVALSKRVRDRPLASVTLVNMRDEYAEEGPDVVLSRALRAAIGSRLERREQVVVLLNRRGYATAVFCRQCGDTIDCPNCSVSLTVHGRRGGRGGRPGQAASAGRAGDLLADAANSAPQANAMRPGSGQKEWRARCHYCNFVRLVPKQCPKCAAPYLERIGFGTERVEAEIARAFPAARLGRVDRDTVQRRGSLTATLDRFASGDLDVLVGTQMIAKGHDFPRVTLVGVISADVGLGLADFRSAERTFQLLTQVAGRAGRGDQSGEALVQTIYPGHYSIRLACNQDYRAFFDKEIEFRRAMQYPPLTAMINIIVRGATHDDAMGKAAALASRAAASDSRHFSVLGPAPAPLTRLRGEHRAQFFLKGNSRRHMRLALQAALAAMPELARKVSVDVDPVSMM